MHSIVLMSLSLSKLCIQDEYYSSVMLLYCVISKSSVRETKSKYILYVKSSFCLSNFIIIVQTVPKKVEKTIKHITKVHQNNPLLWKQQQQPTLKVVAASLYHSFIITWVTFLFIFYICIFRNTTNSKQNAHTHRQAHVS